MDLAAVMDALAARLGTIAGLRVHAYPPTSLTPPAAVVSYPDTYDYDETYGRGSDRMTLPVVVVVGKVSDRSARDQLGAYLNGSGDRSVKAVLESESVTYAAFDSVTVKSAEIDVVTIGGTDYLAATLNLDVYGKGA